LAWLKETVNKGFKLCSLCFAQTTSAGRDTPEAFHHDDSMSSTSEFHPSKLSTMPQ